MDPVPGTPQGYTRQNEEQMQRVLINLNDLEYAISEGNLDTIKKILNFLNEELLPDEKLLSELCRIREFLAYDLIISACKHKQADTLFHLLHKTDILRFLPPNNTNIDLTKADALRTTAFLYAIRSINIDIVELVYEYWGGYTHWSEHDDNDKIINTISRLGELLKKASSACREELDVNQNMKLDVHCLIKFNDFQHTVYNKLRELITQPVFKDTQNKAIRAKEVIKRVLDVYKDYSKLKNIRLEKDTTDEEKQQKKKELEDKSTLYHKWWIYINYEKYFQALDFFVSSMILNNLNILKASNVDVDEIERTVYDYIYRTTDDWRMYLHPNRTMIEEEREGMQNGKKFIVKIKYDKNKIYNAAVLFLERRKVKRRLKNFIKNIETCNNNNRCKDSNYLKLSPHMRDYYSLKKMVYYLEACEMKDGVNILIIERALQVIGEMMKTSNVSNHLSVTIRALLDTEISIKTMCSIKNIRNYISKNTEQLRIRIKIAENNDQTFDKIKKDLKKIKERIISVLEIYKPIFDKSLLLNGITLLDERIEEWPCVVSQHMDTLRQGIMTRNNFDCDHAYFDDFMKEVGNKIGITKGLLKEITYTIINKNDLLCKMEKVDDRIKDVGTKNLPRYIATTKYTLETIQSNKQHWEDLKRELNTNKIKIKNKDTHPTHNEIDVIKKELKKMMKEKQCLLDYEKLLERVNKIQDFSKTWESIQNMLTFFNNEMSIFDKDALNKKISDDAINAILTSMEKHCSSMLPTFDEIKELTTFDAIEELTTFDGIEELETKLDNGDLQRNRLASLIDRVGRIKNSIGYPKKLPSQLMQDLKFRITVEMLMNDIGSIFRECNIKYLMDKSTKLLVGVNLRNVLAHGNPILEVIGDILYPNDLFTELISKAMMVAEDGESIEALYKLFNDGITSETIEGEGERGALNEDQIKTIQQFKLCKRWKDYLKLIQSTKKK